MASADKKEEFLMHAREARRAAAKAKDAGVKIAYLRAAEQWKRLATEVEKQFGGSDHCVAHQTEGSPRLRTR